MALAFGLGGRETAAQMLAGAYDKGQEQKGQVKHDMRTRQGARQAGRTARPGKANGRFRRRPQQPPPAAYRP